MITQSGPTCRAIGANAPSFVGLRTDDPIRVGRRFGPLLSLPRNASPATPSPLRGEGDHDRRTLVTFILTCVPITVTPQSSLIEGHDAEAHRVMGARAVPAGGFAGCSRAAWVSASRHYDRGGRCIPGLGQAKAGNTRSDHVPRKPGLKPSLWDEIIP